MTFSLPVAHETWFDVPATPSDWGFATEGLTLALLLGAVLAALLVRALPARLHGVDVPQLSRLLPFMPFAIRMHLAVSLVGLLSMGTYLSPAMELEPSVGGVALGATMAVVAISMATGFHVRRGALLLVLAGPLGMLEFGVLPVLQRIDLLGLAVFVGLVGAGRWSADHEQGRTSDPALEAFVRGIWSVRVAAGLALIVVAFAEKLAEPQMAVAFLTDHPELNVAQQVGLDWSHLEFARVAGAVEVLFGLLLISGALPQACVLIAGVPFNATLYFFGTTELLGHLPIYGAMLLLLVAGSDPRVRPGVRRMWPWAGLSGAARRAARRSPRAPAPVAA